MKITFYGHASLGIQTEEHNILVDPFITGNPLAKGINIDSLLSDFILVTHAHQDHVLDVEAIAKRTGAQVISNFEIASYYDDKGIKSHPMSHGGSWSFDFGKVKYVNAIHTSSFPDGTYGGQPGGFILESDGKFVYIAGDTALTMDMKIIDMQYNLDLAILPIGDNFTMGPDDAVIASDWIGCDKILGYHYDTFPYIEIDKTDAVKKFEAKGKELILLDIGGSVEI